MNLAPFRRRLGVELLAPVLAFAGILAVPVLESFHGNWPGARLNSPETFRSAVDGTLAARIEKELSDNSICAKVIRPYYNEALYLLFERINPGAVLGKDEWLFESNWGEGLSPDESEVLAERYAAAFASISESLRRLDCRIVYLVVPSKWVVHKDKLPSRARLPDRMLNRILPRLIALGVDVFPAEEVIRSLPYPQFRSTDTHWTNETAVSVWESLVAWIRDSGIGLSGPPASGRIERGGTYTLRSDLLELLGFNEGSRVERRFLRPSRVIIPHLDGPGGLTHSSSEETMALVGTSFSFGFRGAKFLSILSGHRWEDRAVGGGHPHVLLGSLAEELIYEGKTPPKLVVFEFPERYLVGMRWTFLPGIERIARELEIADSWADEPDRWVPGRAFAISDFQAIDGGGFTGLASSDGGRFVLDLPDPPCSPLLVSYSVESDSTTGLRTVVLGVTEDGYDMESAQRLPCKPGPNQIRVMIASSSGKPFKQIVIRPVVGDAKFTISNIVVRRRK